MIVNRENVIDDSYAGSGEIAEDSGGGGGRADVAQAG